MIADASVLLLATDSSHPSHETVKRWWEGQLSGVRRVGVPWPVLMEFLRISTDPSLCARPLDPADAGGFVRDWLRAAPVWIPVPGERHSEVLTTLLTRYSLRGRHIGHAELVALAMQHGGPVCTTDSVFSTFQEVEVVNPLGLAAQRW